MPCPTFEIEETYVNVMRPAILKICADVLRLTGASKDTEVVLKGYGGQYKMANSAMGGEDVGVGFNQEPRLDVTVEMDYPENTFFTGQTSTGEQSIFRDDVNAITVDPIFIEREISLSMKYTCPSRITVDRWRDRIRRDVALGLISNDHDVEYHYPIPTNLAVALFSIYTLADTARSFPDWMKENTSEVLSLLTNRNGEGEALAINQRQVGIVGYWDFEKAPEVSRVEDGDNYEVTFTYKFRLKQPQALRITYPLIVNNSLVPSDLRPQCDFNETTLLSKKDMLRWGNDALLGRHRADQYPSNPVTIPCYDDWLPAQVPMGTAPLATAITVVDDSDPTAVLPLLELGDRYEYSDWMIELIRLFKDKVVVMGASPVLFSLYQNEVWLADNQLTVTDDLYLRTTAPLRPECRYHLRVGLYTDLTLLSEEAHKLLMRNGALTQKLFATLGRDIIAEHGYSIIPATSPDGVIAKYHYWKFLHMLRHTAENYKNGIEVNRLTVGTCIVTADRK